MHAKVYRRQTGKDQSQVSKAIDILVEVGLVLKKEDQIRAY